MKYVLSFILVAIIGFGSWKGISLSKLNAEQVSDKSALADLNRVNYGLFNIQLWKEKALNIFGTKIKEFKLDPQVYNDVEKELQKYLRKLYKEYIVSGKLLDGFIAQAEKDGKINKLFAKLIKDNVGDQIGKMGIDKQIPTLAKTLSAELKANEGMLVGYLKGGLENLLFSGSPANYVDPRQKIYEYYGQTNLEETNTYLKTRVIERQAVIDSNIKMVYLLLLGAVLLSFVLYKILTPKIAITLITLSSIVLLLLGVTMPMIDIDARLNGFTMDVVGSAISFNEQYLYYQSKSILDVTKALIEGRGIDLKIVGILILLFSIVVPFLKLLLSMMYLYNRKSRSSKIVKNIIFYLGKWSMADVFVVAMFMAYIGFYGLVTSQLGQIGRNQNGFAVETINYSQLSPGALFFTTYCILSIIIGMLIHRIDKKSEVA